jgi:hypothetical protein
MKNCRGTLTKKFVHYMRTEVLTAMSMKAICLVGVEAMPLRQYVTMFMRRLLLVSSR